MSTRRAGAEKGPDEGFGIRADVRDIFEAGK